MPVWTTTLPANKPMRVLGGTKSRIAFTLFNDSNYDVYIGFGPGVAVSGASKGVKLGKSGGSFQENDHKGEVYVITATACEITVEDVISNNQGGD